MNFSRKTKKKFFSFYISQHSTTSDIKPRAFRISACFLISVQYFLLNSRVQKQWNLNPRHPAVSVLGCFPATSFPLDLAQSSASAFHPAWASPGPWYPCVLSKWRQELLPVFLISDGRVPLLPFPLTEGNPGDAKVVGNYCYCLFLPQTNSILGLFQGGYSTVKLQLGSVSVVTGSWGFLSLLQIGAFVLQCREMQAWDNPRDLEKWRCRMRHGGVREWDHKRCGS